MYSADMRINAFGPSSAYDDTDVESDPSWSFEIEQAMSRAQQRARAFVTPTAKPKMINDQQLTRNKSNEQIKSSLKVRPNLVRAHSEPSTKSVHFSSTNLEDIRPFKRTQSPSAVSRRPKFYSGTSQLSRPDDASNHDSLIKASTDETDDDDDDDADTSYDEDEDEEDEKSWTSLTPGFAPHAMGRLRAAARPDVYLDNIQLNSDQTALKATVYVRNLSFEKYVALRYSIDGWRSFCETAGKWSADIRKFDRDAGFDRFDINVPLDQFDNSILNSRSLKACVRYFVNGKEIWDNNDGKDYEFFSRNPNLASMPLETIPKRVSEPRKSFHRHSMPVLAEVHENSLDDDLNTSSLLDTETSDDSDANSSYGLSSSDYLRRVGVRVRKADSQKQDDPFFGRYSFATSYKTSPKKVTTNYDDSTSRIANTVGEAINSSKSEKNLASEVGSPHRAKSEVGPDLKIETALQKGQERGRPGASGLKLESSGKCNPADMWESDSYKDFVSKYCFFTPTKPDSADKHVQSEQLPKESESKKQAEEKKKSQQQQTQPVKSIEVPQPSASSKSTSESSVSPEPSPGHSPVHTLTSSPVLAQQPLSPPLTHSSMSYSANVPEQQSAERAKLEGVQH